MGTESDSQNVPADSRSIKEVYQEVRDVYLADDRPWVLGYSGGKDSTCALQVIWSAISELPPEKRKKPVYIISSDTLVETPVIVEHIYSSLARMNEAGRKQGLPFTASKVVPEVKDSFWVNLLGRGYPAPSNRFRWCTERLKIRPADRFINEKVSEFGEVVLILGVRRGESMTRDQVLKLRRIKGSLLSTHTTLAHAFVYTPVVDFSVDDVWQYLLQVPSPWGNNNRDLVALYRNASSGECPLVVDSTTPSCGNSRFGCWVCTVVEKDKSMESLVDNGEEWMLPLLEFRDLLSETQDPEKKKQYRDYRRRDGQVWMTSAGDIARGPYTLDTCKDFLRRLLKIQKSFLEQRGTEAFQVIAPEELREIRRIWQSERHDWQDSIPQIYREEIGDDLDWALDDSASYSGEDYALLEACAKEEDVAPDMVASLIDLERDLHGMTRRSKVTSRLDRILGKDWRSEEQVVRMVEEKKIQEKGEEE